MGFISCLAGVKVLLRVGGTSHLLSLGSGRQRISPVLPCCLPQLWAFSPLLVLLRCEASAIGQTSCSALHPPTPQSLRLCFRVSHWSLLLVYSVMYFSHHVKSSVRAGISVLSTAVSQMPKTGLHIVSAQHMFFE